ncbi:hypothetical protein ACGC1H_006954 [Rhizoctonia solani]
MQKCLGCIYYPLRSFYSHSQLDRLVRTRVHSLLVRASSASIQKLYPAFYLTSSSRCFHSASVDLARLPRTSIPISFMTSENRRWNRLADRMAFFHAALAAKFDSIYAFSDGSFARIMPLPAYLRMIMEFHDHLDMHHNIEETYVFPVLAQKMPNFASNERHKNSHKVIHAGLDKLKDLVTGWKEVPTTFSPATLRSCLDEFKSPLFKHLEEEV